MSIDQELKDAFARHAGDAAPHAGAWPKVEARIVRAHRRRVAALTSAVAAVIVAVAVSVPLLLAGDPAPNFAEPGGPEPTMTGDPTVPPPELDGWSRFLAQGGSYQLLFPPEWVQTMFEEQTEFHPRELPSTPLGDPTFAVTVFVASLETPECPSGDARAVEIGGRSGTRCEFERDGQHEAMYVLDWSEVVCRNEGYGCEQRGTPVILVARVFGSTPDLWSAYAELGERVVRTIQPSDEPPNAIGTGAPTKTPRGEIAVGIPVDPHTRLLVKFMEARLAGGGAIDLLGEGVASYETEPGLTLYGEFVTYEIQTRGDARGDAAWFRVSIETVRDGERARVSEIVTVGFDDDGGLAVLGATSGDQ